MHTKREFNTTGVHFWKNKFELELDSYRFYEGRLESGTRFQQRNRADSQDFEDFGWFLRVNWMGSAEPNPYKTPTVQ